MLQITTQMKVFLGVDPVDFRKGIDRLVSLHQCPCQAGMAPP